MCCLVSPCTSQEQFQVAGESNLDDQPSEAPDGRSVDPRVDFWQPRIGKGFERHQLWREHGKLAMAGLVIIALQNLVLEVLPRVKV